MPPADLRNLLTEAVADRVFPGAVYATGDLDTLDIGTVGRPHPDEPAPMVPDALFDLASLTKIIGTWALLGTIAADPDLRDLDAPLASLLPDAAGRPTAAVTLRQLLTHTAGMPLRANLAQYGTRDPAEIRAAVLAEPLRRPPGEAVEYTDRAALILGYLLEDRLGPFDVACRTRVWEPLGMTDTRFGPVPPERAVPTEYDAEAGAHVRGSVHDYSTRLLGGVSPVSGVFSTAADLALFCRAVLEGGAGWGAAPDWVATSLRVHTGDLWPPRGLGWHPALHATEADDVWCHTGFTGTSLWVCRKQGRFGILLTNKVLYTRDRKPLNTVRDRFWRLAFQTP
ncbi:MAG: serine hydrolase domain-containing protein [Mycobacteriales bacterium]